MSRAPVRVARIRRLASVILALVRVDARSPGVWLVVIATLMVVAFAPASRPAAAAAAGVLLAVAAAGGVVRAPATADLPGLRLAARLVWPLGAAVVGTGVFAALGHDACGRGVVSSIMVVAAIATAVAMAAVKHRPRMRPLRDAMAHDGPAAGHANLVGRSWLDGVAMASTLLAMAVCFFLVPEWSGWYAVVATSWFTLLAVPTATLVGGDSGLRRDLAATAPGRPRWAGAAWCAGSTLAAYGAVLGWPAAVAALLVRDRSWTWGDPLVTVASLACMTAAASALAWVAATSRWRDDATLTAMAAMHATAIAVVSRTAQAA